MLLELVVENYAVVERVRVRFHAGLNLLTGETGSGKSIVVDALGLVLGGRASADMVRSDTDRARISAIFEAPQQPACRALLDAAGIAVEEGELLIEREVLAGGKSRAFLGNRPVTVALLRELAPYLGDIHGQHEQQQLFSPESQLDLLDDFAGLEESRDTVGGLFRHWRGIQSELEALTSSEQEKLRLADLWSFQRKEIEAAALKPEEDTELENERLVLKNVARLQENANAAYSALYDSPESASAEIRIGDEEAGGFVQNRCQPCAGAGDTEDARLSEWMKRPMRFAIIWTAWKPIPTRLEHVESRLELIERLKRKYGSSLKDVLDVSGLRPHAVGCRGKRGRAQNQTGAGAGAVGRSVSRRRGSAHQTADHRRREADAKSGSRAGIARARECRLSDCGAARELVGARRRCAWSF